MSSVIFVVNRVLKAVKGRSARVIGEYHRQRGWSVGYGSFWQDGFHDHALRSEEDIKAVARYVIANPLRAGLVKHIGDYPLWDAKWLSCE